MTNQPHVEASHPFALIVSLRGRRPRRFEFDRVAVVVGRGIEADLRIDHPAVSRRQFSVERILPPEGPPRFRVTPFSTRNPTLHNGQPAVEGSLCVGDAIEVGPIRVTLARGRRRPPPAQKGPRRWVLVACSAALVLLTATLFLGGGAPPPAEAAAPAPGGGTPLFGPLAPASCPDSPTCAGRARESLARGKRSLAAAAQDPGAYYRATIELAYAVSFARAAGEPLPDLDAAPGLLAQAAATAERAYEDARFQLERARESGDAQRIETALSALEVLIPDPTHPMRQAITAERRQRAAAR